MAELEPNARRASAAAKEYRKVTNELEFQVNLREKLKKLSIDYFKSLQKSIIGEKGINAFLSNQQVMRSKIGIWGKKANASISTMNNNWQAGNVLLAAQNALQTTGYKTLQLINRALYHNRSMVKSIADHWGLIVVGATAAWGWFKKIDEINSRFRIQVGAWEGSVDSLQNTNREILGDLMHANVELEDIYNSTLAIGQSFGSYRYATRDVTANLAYWEKNLGVSTKDGAELLRVFASISGSTADAQLSMANFTQRMAEAAGVPLNQTMQDIAAASRVSYSMLSRTPLALAKAAVEARRFGTTLDAMAKSGRQLLDFTDSINAEMNASVLIGKAVNLQRARELAYRKDQVGFQREVIRLATEEVDFNKLDVFQQEAFAKALGKSADEIARMITARNQESWIMAKGSREQREQLENLKKLEGINESIAKDQGEQAQRMMMTRANQAKLVQLQNTWNQLVFQLVEVFVPLINTVLKIGLVILKIGAPLVKVIIAFRAISSIIRMTGSFIGRWIPVLAKVGGVLGRFAGPLSLVFSLVMGIWNAWDNLRKIWSDPSMDPGRKILSSLGAVAAGIFEALISPFKKAFEWLQGVFLGNSPSKIGLMIVAGLKAVGSMIFNNIIAPFRVARWAVSKLFGGKPIAANLETPVMKSSTAESVGVVRSAVNDAASKTVEENKMGTTEKLLSSVLQAINGLRDDLNSGKVVTNIDSQLAGTLFARQTLFRKGYGTNEA